MRAATRRGRIAGPVADRGFERVRVAVGVVRGRRRPGRQAELRDSSRSPRRATAGSMRATRLPQRGGEPVVEQRVVAAAVDERVDAGREPGDDLRGGLPRDAARGKTLLDDRDQARRGDLVHLGPGCGGADRPPVRAAAHRRDRSDDRDPVVGRRNERRTRGGDQIEHRKLRLGPTHAPRNGTGRIAGGDHRVNALFGEHRQVVAQKTVDLGVRLVAVRIVGLVCEVDDILIDAGGAHRGQHREPAQARIVDAQHVTAERSARWRRASRRRL